MDNYEVRLAKIATVHVGYQTRGRIEEDLGGNYKIIRAKDFNGSSNLLLGEAMRFSPKIDPKKYLVDSGDILVQARGQNHFAIIVNDEVDNTVASNSFYIIRVQNKKELLPEYLTWWLNQKTVQYYFKKARGVSTIPFVSKVDLQNTRIRIPPIEIQENISKLMQLWEREQKLNEQLLEKKDLLIQEVCRKASIT